MKKHEFFHDIRDPDTEEKPASKELDESGIKANLLPQDEEAAKNQP